MNLERKILNMKRIDSHVHLNDERFDVDREEVLQRIQEEMDFVVNIGYDLESSQISLDYARKYPFIYATVGLHPAEEEEYTEELEKIFERMAKEEKVLAIGEIAKKLVEVVKEIPLEHLILETDCPYMAPTPYRGQRNEPIYTKEVAMKIAELKGISYEEVVEVTNQNTRKAYGML